MKIRKFETPSDLAKWFEKPAGPIYDYMIPGEYEEPDDLDEPEPNRSRMSMNGEPLPLDLAFVSPFDDEDAYFDEAQFDFNFDRFCLTH